MRRYAIIATLLIGQNAFALSEGDTCSPQDRLPRQMVCFDGAVTDCQKPQGRIGYMVCAGVQLRDLEREMAALYSKILRSFNRPPEDGIDFEAAKKALAESQSSWMRYAKADCALGEALFGPGNAGAPVAMDCQVSHVKSRIRQLQALQQGGK